MRKFEHHTTEINRQTSQMDERGVEIEAICRSTSTMDPVLSESGSTMEHRDSFADEETKSIERELAELQTSCSPQTTQPRKFNRIRSVVQKLNEDFFESEQCHKAAMKELRDQLETQEEKSEVLECKVKTLTSLEQENVVILKRAAEKIKKMEVNAENHKTYVKMASERISALEAKEKETARMAEEKVIFMEFREEKVLELAKKAAIKIKELESFKKKQAANVKTAVENIRTLKKMLLAKNDDMQALQQKALQEYDLLTQELVKYNNQRMEVQSSLVTARKDYKNERKLRKADQKKIELLRKMIEQYDDGVESTWSDLSNALSEEDATNPMCIYRDSTFTDKDELEEVKREVYTFIPDEIKANYSQVGFLGTNDYHFPVLALGPFDVPPGELRDKWLENASSSLGVYYYGQPDVSLAYDMIPSENFIPYAEGVAKDFHIIPTQILEKSLEGKELSAMEQVFEDGIKKVNSEARTSPEYREHPLKDFSEFKSDPPTQDQPEGDINTEELRTKFMETIGTTASGEGLHEKLGEIKDLELLEITGSRKIRKGARHAEKKKLKLGVDLDCEASCDSSCFSAVSGTSLESGSCADSYSTISLEREVKSIMHELVATSTTHGLGASSTLETCPETSEAEETVSLDEEHAETKDGAAEARDGAVEARDGVAENRDDVTETKEEVDETREDVSESNTWNTSRSPVAIPSSRDPPSPSPTTRSLPPIQTRRTLAPVAARSLSPSPIPRIETPSSTRSAQIQPSLVQKLPKTPSSTRSAQAQPSLVQERLKMFASSQKQVARKTTIIPDSSAKDLMKMWQRKAAAKAEPKAEPTPTNRIPKKAPFPVKVENIVTTPKQKNTTPVNSFSFETAKSAEFCTRTVTIPKNILKKIEAGGELTECEKQILEGIQKLKGLTPSYCDSVTEDDETATSIVQQSSTVSGITCEGSKVEDKHHLNHWVNAE